METYLTFDFLPFKVVEIFSSFAAYSLGFVRAKFISKRISSSNFEYNTTFFSSSFSYLFIFEFTLHMISLNFLENFVFSYLY